MHVLVLYTYPDRTRRGERAAVRVARSSAVGASPSGGSAGDARAGGWGRSRRAAYLSQMLKTTTGWTFAEATWPTPITGRKATMSAARRREGAPARI